VVYFATLTITCLQLNLDATQNPKFPKAQASHPDSVHNTMFENEIIEMEVEFGHHEDVVATH